MRNTAKKSSFMRVACNIAMNKYSLNSDNFSTFYWAKWGGIPLLVLILLEGMPLNGIMPRAEELWIEQVYEQTQAAVNSYGFENAIVLSLLTGILYLFSMISLIRYSRRRVEDAVLRFWPFTLQILFMVISLIWVEYYPEKVGLNILHSLGTASIALIAAIHFRQEPLRLVRVMGVVLGLNVIVHMLPVLIFPQIGVAADGRWGGFFSHSNSFGLVAYCAVWANAAALIYTKSLGRRTHILYFIISLIALIGSGSGTSIVSALVALVGLYVLSGKSRKQKMLILGVSTYLFVVGFLLYKMYGFFEVTGKSSDLSGRDIIWEEGIRAILMQPLYGWAFDDHAHVNQVIGMAHSSYHNGYIDLAVRGGAISLIFCFALFSMGIKALLRSSTTIQIQSKNIFLPFVLSLLVYNIAESTFFGARHIAWVIFLTILFFSGMRDFRLRRPIP